MMTATAAILAVTVFGASFAQTVEIRKKIEAKESANTSSMLVKASHIVNNAAPVVDTDVDVYRLSVDGQHIAYFETEQEALDTLNDLKANYIRGEMNTQSVSFVEDVVLSEESVSIYEFDTFATKDEALDYISTGSLVKDIYVIEAGDTLNAIARDRDMPLDDVLAANPDLEEDTLLQIGQEINLLVPEPIISVKTVEVHAEIQNIDYDVIEEETDELYEGDRKVIVEGERGKNEVETVVTYINGTESSIKTLTENIIKEPVDKVVQVGTKERPAGVATGSMSKPFYGYIITSPFGPRYGRNHNGIDLAAPVGTGVYAADGGTVVHAGWKSSFGKLVIIDHGNGIKTMYAHLSEIYVNEGDAVTQGDYIAASGNTGRSTGPHLHFEIRVNGTAVNPANYIGF